MKESAAQLEEVIAKALPLLHKITDAEASVRPLPGKWSPKELVGHLIDSAGNNQQKFIRCMEQDGLAFPNYAQDFWVTSQHYQAEPWDQIVALWEVYNRHIAHIMRHIPGAALTHKVIIGSSGDFTLAFIVKDYVEHLKHHLKQLFPKEPAFGNQFRMVY